MIAIVDGSGSIGTPIGLGWDLVARLTGGRFPIGATRVGNYRANTRFAHARSLATSCMPGTDA